MATPARKSARSGNPAVRADGTKIVPVKKAATKKAASAQPAAISIEAQPRKKYPVELVGVRYTVAAPKSSLALKMATQARNQDTQEEALDSMREWIGIAFGSKAGDVIARLDDPEDELDLDHIMILMNRLVEVDTGNPTTSPSGSRTSR